MTVLAKMRFASALLAVTVLVLVVYSLGSWQLDFPEAYVVWPLIAVIGLFYLYIDRLDCPACGKPLLKKSDVAVLKAPIIRMTVHGRCLHCGDRLNAATPSPE